MRSRRLATRRAANAAGTTVAVATPEVEVAGAILGVEAAGRVVAGAGRAAVWDEEEAWAAGEDNPIAAQAA